MQKFFFILFFYFHFLGLLKGQEQFEKIFYTSGRDLMASSVKNTDDGGYIITGTENLNGDDWNVFLLKVDSLGDTLWTKKYMRTDQNAAYHVSETFDSGFIIGGKMGAINGLGYFLIKTDSIGDTLWVKTFAGTSSSNVPMHAQQTSDSGYVICGLGNCLNSNNGIAIVKTDVNGDIVWSKNYGDTLQMNINGIAGQQTFDGGYVFTGRRLGNGYDCYLIKTDSNGDILWSEDIGGPDHENLFSISQTEDSGLILSGFTTINNFQYILLIKTNSTGDTIWTKAFHEPAFHCIGYSVKQTFDKGFIIAGIAVGSDTHIYVIKTDSLGNLIWSRDFGGAVDDVAYSVEQTPDSGFIIAGLSDTIGIGGGKLYLIKTDANGNSGCNLPTLNTISINPPLQITHPYWAILQCSITAESVPMDMESGCDYLTRCSSTNIISGQSDNSYYVYPNPTKDFLFIETGLDKFLSCDIFNIIGDEIYPPTSFGNHKLQIDMRGFHKGIYFLRLHLKNEIIIKKVILE